MTSKLAGLALQRWQAGPEDESVVDAMCDFAQTQMDEVALRVFEDTRERAAKLADEWNSGLGDHGRGVLALAEAIRAMQPER